MVTWGALVEVSREGKADGEAVSYQQTAILEQYRCVINSLHSNLAEQPYTNTSVVSGHLQGQKARDQMT